MSRNEEYKVETREISRAVIKRLPRYYRYLGELMEEGVERISSKELSQRMSVTASQIRQDLNHFGGFGQQGYGYNVAYLYEEIAKIIGLTHTNHMIIIGAGNLGQALANYGNFSKRGFVTEALFDIDPKIIGTTVRGIPVLSLDELDDYLQTHSIQIATLTIPKAEAVKVAKRLVKGNVKAIWNFAHTDLDLPADVVVENVHLSESLMRLSYNISRREQGEQI